MTPKSFDEHVNYLHGIVRLKLHFLWTWLHRHPEETFRHAIRKRVDIYRKTDINEGLANHKVRRFDDPRWIALENQLAGLYEEHHDDATADPFEAEGFKCVQPLIDLRARRDYEEPPEAIAFGYRCGSLDFDPPESRSHGRVFLHMANALTPHSVFTNPRYLVDCLMAVVHRSREEYEAFAVETFSWVNSHPRWVEYFPWSWRDNMGPEVKDPDSGFAYWGQFVTARGTLNEKAAAAMRRTGTLPFWPRHAWCDFHDLECHLKGLLANPSHS